MTDAACDNRPRCRWPGTDPLYRAYHDEDWGVPERDSRALWEKLVLDGFQAGLAWITILRKRETFRAAFDGFDPDIVATYGEGDFQRLMADPGIVRSNAKIRAAIASAQLYVKMRDEEGVDFADYLWSFVGGTPIQNALKDGDPPPVTSPEAEAMSSALKKRGFKFVGPVIVYAFMQAVGMVNDHTVECFRHAECQRMG
jgi:DNA-3-methyladenine glycosylase I